MTDSSEISLPEQRQIVSGQAQSLEQEAALKPVVRAIRHLEDVIEAETRLLLEGGTPDLVEINARKSRGLYDFNKAMTKASNLAGPSMMKSLQPLLDGFKQKLEKNCEALQMHLRAVGELADLIRGALETQDADGTYSRQSARLGHVR